MLPAGAVPAEVPVAAVAARESAAGEHRSVAANPLPWHQVPQTAPEREESAAVAPPAAPALLLREVSPAQAAVDAVAVVVWASDCWLQQ